MNKPFITISLSAVLLCWFFGVLEVHGQRNGQRQRGSKKQNSPSRVEQQFRGGQQGSLSDDERASLIHMREEEKLARDVYLAMNAKWGDQVFVNIASAESQHMNAVGQLLSQFRIPDPIKFDKAGVFTDQRFQQLYNSLVATGMKSRQDALKVGLKIEELDIADLKSALASTKNESVKRVLGNLLRGSRNHLRAFASRLSALGGTYAATTLTQTEFDQIANSKQESGGWRQQQNSSDARRQGRTDSNRMQRGRGRPRGRGGLNER